MPPFQDEGPEKTVPLQKLLCKRQLKPFGCEGEEVEWRPAKRRVSASASGRRPFDDELSEDQVGDDECDGDRPDPIFSLGWQSLHTFVKSTAWGRHDKQVRAEEAESKKRPYNNTKRLAASEFAGNTNKMKNVYQTSGQEPKRILSLIQTTCKCALS